MSSQRLDGRVAAWLNAWESVEAAREMRMKKLEHDIEYDGVVAAYEQPMPANYWAVLAEAHAYAALAGCPDVAVGLDAGSWLTDEAERKAEARASERRFGSAEAFMDHVGKASNQHGDLEGGEDEDNDLDEDMRYVDYDAEIPNEASPDSP